MVDDHRAMVTDDHWWFLGVTATSLRPTGRREVFAAYAPNTSLRPVGRRNGAGSLLSVGDCRTAVCSSLYWSLSGLKQSAATKVANWWATMVANC